MCELLGLAFNEPVTSSLSFRGFRHRAEENPDGWGLAWFDGRKLQVSKEPRRADRSSKARKTERDQQLRSKIFIGHVRRASHGEVSETNTHPFLQPFGSAGFVLAHNGTLSSIFSKEQLDGSFRPTGKTDSEHLLCALLTRLSAAGIGFSHFAQLRAHLTALNAYGKMNLLFSDGERLFAYRDQEGRGGLSHTFRTAPFGRVHLEDKDWCCDLAEQKSPTQCGYVIATKALTNEEWVDIEPGCLCVFEGGTLVFPA